MRILIFISSQEYVRNYITTDAFGAIDGHTVKYLLLPEVASKTDPSILLGMNLVSFVLSSNEYIRARAFRINNLLQMYDKRKRNITFLFRLRRELIPSIYSLFVVPKKFYIHASHPLMMRLKASGFWYSIATSFIGGIKVVRNTIAELPGLIMYLLIALTVRVRLKPILSYILWRWVPIAKGFEEILLSEQPDLIIIPSSIVDATSYELIRANSRINLSKVLLLIDNWDNLSSKSTFIKKPDFLGVIGQQGAGFAVDIHDIDLNRVSVLGTPRFEVYKAYIQQRVCRIDVPLSDPIAAPYILFAGCAVGFDEIGALRALSIALSDVQEQLPPNTKILYRPHPWGGREGYLNELASSPIKHVIIDPQIQANIQIKGLDFQPDLSYYPQLLADALLVVCPLSTMILEATIMRKQVLALVHEDHVSLLSPNRMLDNYMHFNGLECLKNVALISDLDTLGEFICQAYKNNGCIMPEGLDLFVDIEDPTYAIRLGQLVNKIESIVSLNRLS